MKTLTKIAAIALAISAMAACSKDDGPETGGGDNKVTERPESIMKPLADAGYVLTQVDVDNSAQYKYEYDKRDLCINASMKDLVFSYDSKAGYFTCNRSYEVYPLNLSGFFDQGYTYSNEQELTQVTFPNDSEKIIWKDGNVITLVQTVCYSKYLQVCTFIYTYSDQVNKYRSWTYAMNLSGVNGIRFLGFAGLFGHGSTNLPSAVSEKVVRIDYDGTVKDFGTYKWNIAYELSEDGRILKETMTDSTSPFVVTYTYGPSSQKK